MQPEKRPRHWANEIALLPTKEERQERLNQAPSEWRELIKSHLKIVHFQQQHRG
jgi:hypothetical protein